MITELMPMLDTGRPVLLSIAKLKDGQVRVCSLPAPMKGDTAMHDNLKVPLEVQGTPEQLDQQLPAALQQYTKGYTDIADAIAAVAAQQAAAAQKVKDDAAKPAPTRKTKAAIAAATTAVKPEAKAPEPDLQGSILDTLLPSPETQAALQARQAVESAAGDNEAAEDEQE